MPTIEEGQRAVRYNFILMAFLLLVVGWLGMVIYAVYAECDPILTKQVKKQDQLLPLLVLHVAGDIPGLPGLFMAGIFSGSLSSISSGLNSLAAIGLRDFMPESCVARLTDPQQVGIIMWLLIKFCWFGRWINSIILDRPTYQILAYF